MLTGLPPLVGIAPRWLILGSFPSLASLAAGGYYAHTRNAFWPIMGALFGFDPTSPYLERSERLTAAGVALWDLIAACRRAGSRDEAIDPVSIRLNDIVALLGAYPTITGIVTNGTLATRLFRRHFWTTLPSAWRDRLYHRQAPSTSPAYASRTFTEKLALWRAALDLPSS